MATYYVSATDGSDGDSGLTEALAWATISKVNGSTFAAGDIVCFKCGDVWRETLLMPSSGTSGAYIKFSKYGTGVNPKILGSNAATTWTNISGNIWKTDITFSNPATYGEMVDIHFLLSGGTHHWGAYKSGTANLVAEYDWCWVTNYIYVYSTTNPAN